MTVVYTFILVICLRMIWRAIMAPRTMKPAVPQCEQCGYAVQGLETFVCPECGGDFRSVGIITARMEGKRRGSYGGALIVWLIACGISLSIAHEFVIYSFFESGWFGPARQRFEIQKMEMAFNPASQQYDSIILQYTFDMGEQELLSPLSAKLKLQDDSVFELIIEQDYPHGYELRDQGGEVLVDGESVDRNAIEAMFERIGFDPSDGQIQLEIWSLWTRLHAAMGGGILREQPPASVLNSMMAGGVTLMPTYVGTFAPALTTGSIRLDQMMTISKWAIRGLIFALWVGGMIWIVRRRRRLLRIMQPNSRVVVAV